MKDAIQIKVMKEVNDPTGRWVALCDEPGLIGCMAYGKDSVEALRLCRVLILNVSADKLKNREPINPLIAKVIGL